MTPSPIDRARAYLSKVPPAISGQGGHRATFYAACACVRLGLSEHEAFDSLGEWNRRCQPPWTERELRHKIRDAFRKVGGAVPPKAPAPVVVRWARRPLASAPPTPAPVEADTLPQSSPAAPSDAPQAPLPFLLTDGTLAVPHDCPIRFRYWLGDIRPDVLTLREVREYAASHSQSRSELSAVE